MTGNRGIIGRAAGLGLLAGLALCLWPVAPAAGDVIGQWSTATLSQPRYGIAATSVGGMAFFAGGFAQNTVTGYSNVVDVYDSAIASWSTGPALWPLATPMAPQATSAGAKAFLTDGKDLAVFDTTTRLWSSTQLPSNHYQGACASAGGLVLFAGSTSYSTQVDIYNTANGVWSTGNLSVGRHDLAATSAANKVFFAGGVKAGIPETDVVDIYDSSTGVWSTGKLSEARRGLSAVSVGSKVLFAGGQYGGYLTGLIDVYNLSDGEWSTTDLPLAATGLSAASVGNRAFFAGGIYSTHDWSDVAYVWDGGTGLWSETTLSQARSSIAETSLGDKVFFAGGGAPLDWRNTVDILTVPEPLTIALLLLGGVALSLRTGVRRPFGRVAAGIGKKLDPKANGPSLQPLEDRMFLSGDK